MKICESQTLICSPQFKLGRTKLFVCPLQIPFVGTKHSWSPQIVFISINAEMVYLCRKLVNLA